MDGWLNLYKPVGISSAKLVAIIKKLLGGDVKIGHAGTLDVEAEGILPLAIGEATKLVKYLVDAEKEYEFEVKFGAQTDTGDASGRKIKETDYLPNKQECANICAKFIGKITQIPPAFSALKINGQRSYAIARKKAIGEDVVIENKPRQIEIFDLKLLNVNEIDHSATYHVTCSKGTYVRTLAEDIALLLQSLGFVIKLCRTKVGQFSLHEVMHLADLEQHDKEVAKKLLENKMIETETILDDIPVLDLTEDQARKIRHGQECFFEQIFSKEQIWLRYKRRLLAIGYISENCFKPQRVFNLN